MRYGAPLISPERSSEPTDFPACARGNDASSARPVKKRMESANNLVLILFSSVLKFQPEGWAETITKHKKRQAVAFGCDFCNELKSEQGIRWTQDQIRAPVTLKWYAFTNKSKIFALQSP